MMYERIETVCPEEKVIQETRKVHFVCSVEGCGHKSQTEMGARTHYARAHTFVERLEIAGYTFYRFETKKNFQLFTSVLPGDGLTADEWSDDSVWSGPGLYTVTTEHYYWQSGDRNLEIAHLVPAEVLCANLRDTVEEALADLREIESRLSIETKAKTIELSVEPYTPKEKP